MAIDMSESFRGLVDEEKQWFQTEQWSEEQLAQGYVTILKAIDQHVELLDRGNANRLVRYYAKKAAMKELIGKFEL